MRLYTRTEVIDMLNMEKEKAFNRLDNDLNDVNDIELLSTSEALEILDITKTMLYRYIKNNRLPIYSRGGQNRNLFKLDSLIKLKREMEDRKARGKARKEAMGKLSDVV